MEPFKQWTVYGLTDPVSRALGYVGLTGRPPGARLAEHVYSARVMPSFTKATKWISSLSADPELVVLAVCADESIGRAVEELLVQRHSPPGNGTKDGAGGAGPGRGNNGTRGRLSSRPVFDRDTGEVWPSVSAAARAIGASFSCLHAHLSGKGSRCRGRRFAYLEEAPRADA